MPHYKSHIASLMIVISIIMGCYSPCRVSISQAENEEEPGNGDPMHETICNSAYNPIALEEGVLQSSQL